MRPLILLLTISTAVALLAVLSSLSTRPMLSNDAQLSHKDIARARQILRQNDPRRLRPGATRGMRLTEQDLDLAASYLMQTYAHGGARVRLVEGQAQVAASAELAGVPGRPFLNLKFSVNDNGNDGAPSVGDLTLGALRLPDTLTHWLINLGLQRWLPEPNLEVAKNAIKRLIINPRGVLVVYRWQPEILLAVRDNLVSPQEKQVFTTYYDLLATEVARTPRKARTLDNLLSPLFAHARERSRDGSAIAENRSLLLVLGAWSSRRGMSALVPRPARRLGAFRLTLDGRVDFAKHFLVSAALAVGGDSLLADAVGIFKEVADTDKGTGFSFTDLAADRAGTRFAERAVASERSARALQARVAGGLEESDLIPKLSDLPEHLAEDEFRKLYGEVGSPAYSAMMTQIENRLDTIPLLRDPADAGLD